MTQTKPLSRALSIVLAVIVAIAFSFTAATVTADAATFSAAKKVTGVKVYARTVSSLSIKWNKTSKANGYQVYRAASKNGKYKKITTTKKTYVTNSKLKRGKAYYYKVRAYAKVGKKYKYGGYSPAASLTAADKGFIYKVDSKGNAKITGYIGKAATLTIPAYLSGHKVTSIGNYAFDSCTSLKSITIPSSVTSIGDGALDYYLYQLTAHVQKGSYAVKYCKEWEINVSYQ